MPGTASGSVRPFLDALLLVALAVALSLVLVAVLRRLARRWDITVLSGRLWQSPVVLLVALATLGGLVQDADGDWTGAADHLLQIGQICAVAWLLIVLVRTLAKAALAKHPQTGLGDEQSRHARTKIDLVQRVAVAAIITVGVGAILWTIPQVRAIGASASPSSSPRPRRRTRRSCATPGRSSSTAATRAGTTSVS
jgi:hypothetical protein